MAILKEGEARLPVAKLTRKHGISAAIYYGWKSKYGGVNLPSIPNTPNPQIQTASTLRG